ncbi:MAG TPA: hypothetical protein VJ719_07875 [Chthoniobacterales bacterium]|nr:hypothetical protein [Chthoniobacterales bacterium]
MNLRSAGAATYSHVPDNPNLPPIARRAIVIVLAAMFLVAIHANVQRLRRDKIETVTVTPMATAEPSPSATPAGQ